MQNNSLDHKVDNGSEVDKELLKIIQELKYLPKVGIPSDFEDRLEQRISRINKEKPTGIIERIFFPVSESRPRILVYSTVVVIIICCVFLSYLILRNMNITTINESTTIDSTTYEGKKVIIIPPTTQPESDQTAQQPLKKLIEPDRKEKSDKQDLYKYFVPPAPTEQEKGKVAGVTEENRVMTTPLKSVKTGGMSTIADSLKIKKDSVNIDKTKRKTKPLK
jgi:hypothetical protein